MSRKNRQIKHIPFKIVSNCDKKRKFRSENEAIAAAEYQMLINPGLKLATYKCNVCNKWHLTRQTSDD